VPIDLRIMVGLDEKLSF